METKSSARRARTWIAFAVLLPSGAFGQALQRDLAGSSLEELMNIEVTSVSKKEQSLSKTAAAIYVISQEDIRRSGATNIPDVLRMAPGVDVAQLDANQWAISVRGFNALYSDKVLVLIDGRAVYVSTFSGVYWDEMDVPLEDIDRIEIIRGPGGTVWGANAVNGVINIITKNAADTKGALVTAGGGSKAAGEGFAQYGGHAGASGAYRVFGKFDNIDTSLFPGGRPAADGWRRWHAGFRSDWGPTARDTLSVQGDVLSENAGGTTSAVIIGATPFQTALNTHLSDVSGDVLVRWERTLGNGSMSLQASDSNIRRDEAGAHPVSDIADVEFEHHFAAGARHDIVWGLDYRFTRDNVEALENWAIHFNPSRLNYNLFAVFAQDEIRLNRSLFLTLGSKFEHNAFTGFEYEPSAQLIWTRNDKHSVWVSAARAIRQPDRVDYSADYNLRLENVPGAGQALVKVYGNPDFKAETMNDYEAGYRAQASRRLSLDFTAFLSFYGRLQTTEVQAPYVSFDSGSPLLVLPLEFANLSHARNYGFEGFANWNVNSRWKISPGYSLLRMHVTPDATSTDSGVSLSSSASPEHQLQIRSLMTLRKNLEWDSSLKYVTSLSSLGIPAYARFDMRLGWHPTESMEISITGQNLTSGRHMEFTDNSGLFLGTEVTRSVFAKISWRL